MLIRTFICIPLIAMAQATWSNGESTDPYFTLSGTTYIGIESEDATTHSFLGIPYASPPVGELRWKSPRPLEDLSTTHQAKNFAPTCAQSQHIVEWYKEVIIKFGGDPNKFKAPIFSENCLYLNIWRPANTSEDDALPVIVYIHGGSNKAGWSYEPNYLGNELSKEGVLVITIDYRLGPFGFFPTTESKPSNFAIMDQVEALRWIQSNIASVGGDPTKITIMGESAGGNNVIYLMASPLTKDLFNRAIIQSSGWALLENQEAEKYENAYKKIMKQLSHIENADQYLRALSWEEILKLISPIYEELGYQAVIDQHSLTEPVAQTLSRTDYRKIDVLIGSNADEWKMSLSEEDRLEEYVLNSLEMNIAHLVLDHLTQYKNEHEALDKLITAKNYVCPSLRIAANARRTGAKSWVYYFSKIRSGKLAESMGAYHGAELPYVFNTHDEWLPTSDEDKKLGRIMTSYWANFAKSGNPNGAELPKWSPYEQSKPTTQILDHPISSSYHPSNSLCELLLNSK